MFKPPILWYLLWQQPGETHAQSMVLLRGAMAYKWADVARGLNKKHKTSAALRQTTEIQKRVFPCTYCRVQPPRADLRPEMSEPR